LGSIDISLVPGLEQERGHVLCEEFPGLRVHDVQTIVVDQHRLLPEPITPALLTDLFNDACADWARKRRFFEAGALYPAARACYDRGHAGLPSGPCVLDLRETEEGENAQVSPTNVKLVPFGRELCRVRVRVVVVVELFPA
jgi:hypothetical protein